MTTKMTLFSGLFRGIFFSPCFKYPYFFLIQVIALLFIAWFQFGSVGPTISNLQEDGLRLALLLRLSPVLPIPFDSYWCVIFLVLSAFRCSVFFKLPRGNPCNKMITIGPLKILAMILLCAKFHGYESVDNGFRSEARCIWQNLWICGSIFDTQYVDFCWTLSRYDFHLQMELMGFVGSFLLGGSFWHGWSPYL